MSEDFFLGFVVGGALVVIGLGAFLLSGRRSENDGAVYAWQIRARFAEALKDLGLEGEFEPGFELDAPLYRLKEALDRVAMLERRLVVRSDASEADARRLAKVLESHLRHGWPFDLETLYALTAYKKRTGEKDLRKSPRLN